MIDPEKQYHASQAAEHLGVTRPTFYNIIKRYDLKPSAHLANMNFYDVKDLEKIKAALSASLKQ